MSTSVSRALVDVLSYDHTDPGRSEKAAEAALVGDARTQYATLVKTLEEKAPGQKLVLSATVQAVGVKELTDEDATLLVFLDQTSRRAGDDEASVSAAQLSVRAVRRADGSWRISDLTPL